MKKCHQGDVLWYEFELLQDFKELAHGIFTKKGGVSKGFCQGLNVSISVGDHESFVNENKQIIREVLKVPSLVMGPLVHLDDIIEVKTVKKGSVFLQDAADGFLTEKKDVGLCMSHADCQVAIFYDPYKKRVAIIHCGWRGLVLNIYQKACLELIQRGSHRDHIYVCVGPSLGPDYAEFIHYQKEFPQNFERYQTRPYFFNLWDIAYDQIKNAGIKPSHIEIAKMCTYSLAEEFYSYRRDKKTGRNATVVALR